MGGGGGGRASFGDLTMQSAGNTLTVRLMSFLARGEFITTATLTDGNITLEMRNVFVTLLAISKPDRHGIAFNFGEFTYSTPSASYCYNIAANLEC